MQQALLPLFPLQLVLVPNAQLALHIFEDRYKEMIGEAIRQKSEFGIVLATEKGIVNTGCTAVVDRVVKQYEDGRMDIVATGRRRFEILLLNEEKDYLRGAVQFFDDEDRGMPSPETLARVQKAFEHLKQLSSSDEEESFGPAQPFSFAVAQAIPDLNFRQLLLGMRSEADRIERLADYLPTLIEKMRLTARVRAIAPTNGHVRHIQL